MKRFWLSVCALMLAVLFWTFPVFAANTRTDGDWISRLELKYGDELPEYAAELYDWLIAESFLDDGALVAMQEGEHGVEKNTNEENGQTTWRYLVYSEENIDVSHLSALSSQEKFAYLGDEYCQPAQELSMQVVNAFRRDYPEVNWLSGSVRMNSSSSIKGTTATVRVYLTLRVEDADSSVLYDIRTTENPDCDAVIRRADEVLSASGALDKAADAEQIAALNTWLTENNAYAYADEYGSIHRDPMTALMGNTGEYGPVCEGYAKAFKILCDRLEIPCVLVSGIADNGSGVPEAHMWNAVMLGDNEWYGVDVTWNDPVVSGLEKEAKSGYEQETYLLVGSEAMADHVSVNYADENHTEAFADAPELQQQDYSCSDSAGENLTWTLEDGILTISGTGAMNHFSEGSAPWYAQRDSIKGVVIGSDVTLIGEFAFSGCTSLTSVSFPANLTRVAQGAFKNCSSLTTFVLPDKVTDLGPSALSGCTKLEYVKLSAKQPAINDATFANCTSLKKAVIPESVTNIAGNGFENCSNVQFYCVSGSAAHSFAQSNNIPFVLTDQTEAVPLLLDIDFENEPLGDFVAVDNSIRFYPKQGSAQVTKFGDTLCVRLDRTNYSAISGQMDCYCDVLAGGTADAWGLCDTWVLSYDMYLEQIGTAEKTSNWQVAMLRMSTPSGTQFQQSTCIKNDTLYTYAGIAEICKVPVGKWFNIATVFDMKNKCFSTYIDGVLVSDSLPWNCNDTSATQATQIRLAWNDGGDGIAYVDNFKAYNGTYGNYKEEEEEEEEVIPSGTCGENLTWTLENGTLTISGTGAMAEYSNTSQPSWSQYKSLISDVVVSEGVTSIGNYAFSGCSALKSLTLSSSVTSIGTRAFQGCANLEAPVFPNNLNSIGDYAFFGCNGLTRVTIPASVTLIGDAAFTSCRNLIEFIVDSANMSYTALDGILFSKNGTLLHTYPIGKTDTEYVIPSGVTEVGVRAFQYSDLNNVLIPEGIKHLGIGAFFGCSNLTSVTLPSTLSSVADLIFTNCANLAEINVASESTFLTSIEGVLFRKDGSILYIYPQGKSDTAYTVPAGVNTIGTYAFAYSMLQNISLPDSVHVIAPYSFEACKALTSLVIPEGVTTIYRTTFRNCTSLTSVTIPMSVANIESNAFSGAKNLTIFGYGGSYAETFAASQNIPFGKLALSDSCGPDLTWTLDDDGTLTISGTGAMDVWEHFKTPWNLYRNNIKKVVLNGAVTNIAAYAFSNCSQLVSIEIPASVEVIGKYAFLGCRRLESVTLAEGLKTIENNAFSSCSSLAAIHLPASLETIGSNVFNGCTALPAFSVHPSSVNFSTDDSGVLFNLEKTSLIAYPAASPLTSYTIPDSVISVQTHAFALSQNLQQVYIPQATATISDVAFADALSLHGIYVDANNPNYANDSAGALFNKSMQILYRYPASASGTSYTVPDGVNKISMAAFDSCMNLTEISIPNSVTNIGAGVFENSKNLIRVILPNQISTINMRTFQYCSSLKEIVLPSSVKSIGQNAFNYCSNLESIVIPASVTSILDTAFTNCVNLKSVVILNKDAVISEKAFNSASDVLMIHGYAGSTAETYAVQKGYGFSAISETMPVVTVSSVKTIAGNTVDVTISISGNTGITGAILSVNYDSALTLTNVASGDAFGSLTFANLAVPYLNPLVLSWDGESNDTSNGTLVTLTFAIPADMPIGDYPIEITYKDNDIFDADLNNVVVGIENGQIIVKDFLYGDVNGDSVINGKDLTLIRRYITGGFELVKFNAEAADVNLDGSINGKDLTLIRRYISGGFGVELGW